jgi:heat shock protein 1/8
VDANGIMNVSAVEKGTGAKKEITIKNEGERLNAEDIERLVKEAEKYKAEDEIVKEKIEEVNKFDGLLYQTKSTLDKKEVSDKLEEEDKELVKKTIKDNEEWLSDNRDTTTKEELEQKTKEFNDYISPIMGKLYQGDAGGMPGGMPDMSNMDPEMMEKMAGAMGGGISKEGPEKTPEVTIDEVD